MNSARAKELVMLYGWNTTCFQILNPGIEHWFSPSGDAVVGYVRHRRTRVVAGAPVCRRERLGDVVAEFEGVEVGGVCYFGAEERLMQQLAGEPGYARVNLGSQPVWHPMEFVERFRGDPSLRAQRNRALNKGVTVREWNATQATNSPSLQRVLEEWLDNRGMPPMHFLVEPQTLGDFQGRRILVAEWQGEPVGFVTLCPAPARRAWLTEQFVRGRRAPNGTIELALLAAAEALARDGAELLTLGLVPLARSEQWEGNPLWLQGVGGWVRAHGRRFYNFDGLEAFKRKFHPERWQPVHAISRETHFSRETLWAIAAAFTGGQPLLAFGRGLVRAVLRA